MVVNPLTVRPVMHRHEEVHPEDEHEQRHAAHHVHHRRGGKAQPAECAHARQRNGHAQRKGERKAEHGEHQRDRQAAQRSVRVLPTSSSMPYSRRMKRMLSTAYLVRMR
jgi:hypothetical protein